MYQISICLFRVCVSRKQFIGMELLRENELNKSDKLQKTEGCLRVSKVSAIDGSISGGNRHCEICHALVFSRFNYGVFNEIKQ